MSGIISLSGWGQPHDALREAAPQAEHIDYAAAGSLDSALDMLSAHAQARTVIGWSMGGQLAVHAVARGILRPETLVLIATPYQFAGNQAGTLGMEPLTLERFRSSYLRDPERTLDKAYALIAHKDTRAGYVQPYLDAARQRVQPHPWLYWLDALSAQSCMGADFQKFPHTLLIHGDHDVVVDVKQSSTFQEALPDAKLHVFHGSSHAPHWHDPEGVRDIISGSIQ